MNKKVIKKKKLKIFNFLIFIVVVLLISFFIKILLNVRVRNIYISGNKYLNDDYYVILDRYTSSNQAHQGSKIRNKDDRFYIYQWIDKLEYWLLKLPKADKTIFLHMPLEVSNILKQNREFLDEHEKSSTHLKNSEEAYIELSELYNWDTIECSKNGVPRDINSIAEDIYKIIIKD